LDSTSISFRSLSPRYSSILCFLARFLKAVPVSSVPAALQYHQYPTAHPVASYMCCDMDHCPGGLHQLSSSYFHFQADSQSEIDIYYYIHVCAYTGHMGQNYPVHMQYRPAEILLWRHSSPSNHRRCDSMPANMAGISVAVRRLAQNGPLAFGTL
jgi:hypothetical protein